MTNKKAVGEIYHIINRGIEGRIIFQNKRDYERFLITILECNDTTLSSDNRHRQRRSNNKISNKKQSQPLVEILVISLMPNHFHIVARQLVDDGIAKFVQRISNSYAKYFNIKNNRKGSLFMSKYKSIHVSKDSQMKHLISYIHANALDLIIPEWRLGKLKNFKKAKQFLENYKWSSYPLYAKGNGLDLISHIIVKDIIDEFYPEPKDHFEAIASWSNKYFETFNPNNLE